MLVRVLRVPAGAIGVPGVPVGPTGTVPVLALI